MTFLQEYFTSWSQVLLHLQQAHRLACISTSRRLVCNKAPQNCMPPPTYLSILTLLKPQHLHYWIASWYCTLSCRGCHFFLPLYYTIQSSQCKSTSWSTCRPSAVLATGALGLQAQWFRILGFGLCIYGKKGLEWRHPSPIGSSEHQKRFSLPSSLHLCAINAP